MLVLLAALDIIFIIPARGVSSIEDKNPEGEDSVWNIRYIQPFEIDSNRIVPSAPLKDFSQEVDSIMRSDSIRHVSIIGAASIDGPEALNTRLAKARAEAMERWLLETTRIPPHLISLDAIGEDWDWFRSLVEASPELPARQSVMEILDADISQSQKEARIKKLDNGRTWQYLAKNILPLMRCAKVDLTVSSRCVQPADSMPEAQTIEPVAPLEEVTEIVVTVIEEEPVAPEEWRRRFYIKTNLPYWLLTWANVALEVDLAPHWSFNVPVDYSACNYFTSTLKFRLFRLQPGFRYWVRPDNRGVFFEAHYGMAWYDFAFKGKYRYQDYLRRTPAIGGGLAAGYRLPISKNGRWAMEFGGGVGVYKLHYNRFINKPNGKLVDTKKKTYFGLDNVNVSISYSFPIEKKKGGIK